MRGRCVVRYAQSRRFVRALRRDAVRGALSRHRGVREGEGEPKKKANPSVGRRSN